MDENAASLGHIEVTPRLTASEVEDLLIGVTDDGACWQPCADGCHLNLVSDDQTESVLELRALIRGLLGPRAAARHRGQGGDFTVERGLGGMVVGHHEASGELFAIRVTTGNRVTARTLWSGLGPETATRRTGRSRPRTAKVIDLASRRARA